MIVLFRTMTAPNGPPLFVRIFSSASATARCMNTCSVMTILDPLTRRMPQVDAELMTEKQVLGYRGSSRLQASPPNHALILPNDANPGRMQFSERTGSRWPRTIRIRQDASVTTTEPAIAVARDQVIDRVADHPWDELEDPCPLPEARAQCAARPRILHRPGRSPRRQRNPGDQDRCRDAQRADVPRPTGSERSENSRGDHVC